MTDEAPAPTLKFDLSRNYYADLELQEKTDDVSLIKRQYRRLSLKKHPDRPGGSDEAFIIIKEAHEILTDGAAKAAYDKKFRPEPPGPSPTSPPPQASCPQSGRPNPDQQQKQKSHYVHERFTNFQPAFAPRTFYLGQIYHQVTKDDVGDLFLQHGLQNFRFWWKDPTRKTNIHDGWVWVEFKETEMAIRAWVILNGLSFRGRHLKVSKISKPGALEPPQEQQQAARGPEPPSPREAPPPSSSPPSTESEQPGAAPQPTEGSQLPLLEPWKVTRGNPYSIVRARVYQHYAKLCAEQEARNLSWGIKMITLHGEPRFLSRAAPPLPHDGEFAKDVVVTVIMRGKDGTWTSKHVKIEDLPEAVNEGWTMPLCPDRQTHPESDKDERRCQRVDDTPDRQQPWNPHHVERFLSKGLKLMKNAGIERTPGQFFGNASDTDHDHNNTSWSKDYILPAESCKDLRSATSRGHSILYGRPANVGTGWGGYSEVFEWQARGRAVNKDMPDPLNWHDPAPTRFASSDNPKHVTDSLLGYKIPPKPEDSIEKRDPPKSLWKKLQGVGNKEMLDAKERSLSLPRTMGL